MPTALVTGASSGIGAVCAARLARNGWRDARLRAGVERLPERVREKVCNRVLLGGT